MHDINSFGPLPTPSAHLCARHCLPCPVPVHAPCSKPCCSHACLPADRLCLVQAKPLWSAAAVEYMLLPRAPGASELCDSRYSAVSRWGQSPVPSCPQDKQAKPSSEDTSPCTKEQHFGGHGSSESSLLLLDLLELGLWMCSSETPDSQLCPPFTPQIISLPLLVIIFISITKYSAVLQEYIFTSQLLATQCHVRVCSMTFPVAFLSCVDSHLGVSPKMYLLVHNPPAALAWSCNETGLQALFWCSLKCRPSICSLNGWLYMKWHT